MKCFIAEDAYKKMRAYIDLCEFEISGMGKVERTEDGSFIVTDVRILEQEVNSASSDMDTTALAKFQVELIQAGENPVAWVCWWHSHAKMAVFWSGKDNTCIDNSTEFPYLLSVVANKKEDILARVDVYNPVRMSAALDVEIMSTQDGALYDICRNDITMKVREEKKYTPALYSGTHKTGGQWYMPTIEKKKSKKQLKREAKEKAKRDADNDSWASSFGFGSRSKVVEIEEEKTTPKDTEALYDERDDLIEELVDARLSGNIENETTALVLLGELALQAEKMGLPRETVTDYYNAGILSDSEHIDYVTGKPIQTTNVDF